MASLIVVNVQKDAGYVRMVQPAHFAHQDIPKLSLFPSANLVAPLVFTMIRLIKSASGATKLALSAQDH